MQHQWLIFAVVLHLSTAFNAIAGPVLGYTDRQLQMTIFPICSSRPDNKQIDACLGCFWRLSTQIQDPNYSGPYTDCSSLYLKSTTYKRCGDNLQENVANKNGTVFCDFYQCIQDLRSKQMILECASEAYGKNADPVDVLTKKVKCILCRSYCCEQKMQLLISLGQYQTALTVVDNKLKAISVPSYTIDSGRLCSWSPTLYGGSLGSTVPECDCSDLM